MALHPEHGHYGEEYGEPSVKFSELPPDEPWQKNKPSLNHLGESIDEILAAELTAQHNSELLEAAQKTFVTQFSRWSLAITGGIVTGTAGGMAGTGAGAAVGYAGAAAIAFATEKVLGIQIPQEVYQFGEQAGEAVSNATLATGEMVSSVISPYIPAETSENFTQVSENLAQIRDNLVQVGRTFYAHVAAGISGISLGGFVGQKTAPYGWNKGDGLGRNIGTRVSLPFVKLHDRIRNIPISRRYD